MNAFESAATFDDASHLTLREPAPPSASRECRVIVLFDTAQSPSPSDWPARFFDEILILDPEFVRPAQGVLPPIAALDA